MKSKILIASFFAVFTIGFNYAHAETIESVDANDVVTLDTGEQLQNYGDEVNEGDDVEQIGNSEKYVDLATGAELEEY